MRLARTHRTVEPEVRQRAVQRSQNMGRAVFGRCEHFALQFRLAIPFGNPTQALDFQCLGSAMGTGAMCMGTAIRCGSQAWVGTVFGAKLLVAGRGQLLWIDTVAGHEGFEINAHGRLRSA
jgi:hypothetical protein